MFISTELKAEEREVKAQLLALQCQALDSKMLRNIRNGRLRPALAEATMVTDSPEKLLNPVGDRDGAALRNDIGERFSEAKREILIITPYFIPQETGTKLIEQLLAKGVRVVIVTNSLASTNHVAVHSGYARYRKRLIKAGAEIHEIRAEFTGDETGWGHSPDLVTLHSKSTINTEYR